MEAKTPISVPKYTTDGTPAFTGGVYVAGGDVNGDGFADIICGADAGGGPNVSVFSGRDASRLMSFFAYDPAFTGGVRVAAGDVTGDGLDDIIAGPGAGGGPNVTVFKGANGSLLASYFAFDPAFTAGIYVATADLNGDGTAEVISGAGEGGGPNITVFGTIITKPTLVLNFLAFDTVFGGGVRVAAGDLNADGIPDIIAGAGPGGGPQVQVYNGSNASLLDAFFAFAPAFSGGIYVAAVAR